MGFADLHSHILCAVDDGAKTAEDMYALLDASRADGVRTLCFTPHYHPGYFGDNRAGTESAFALAQEYVREKYPDMELYLGNELRYDRACGAWLAAGECRTLNASRYLLVDFRQDESGGQIVEALSHLLGLGYTPVLAHAERYDGFHSDGREIEALRSRGVVIQIDALSPFGGWGFASRRRSRTLLKKHLVDLVGSDTHDALQRPSGMTKCYEFVRQSQGEARADLLFRENPRAILSDSCIGKG